jgi:hypothetical protein
MMIRYFSRFIHHDEMDEVAEAGAFGEVLFVGGCGIGKGINHMAEGIGGIFDVVGNE